MQTRNHILALVAAAALLSTTSASAQTERKLFEGVSTYYVDVRTSTECGLSEDFIRKKVTFPLSYSDLRPVGLETADIYIGVKVGANRSSSSDRICYGLVEITANVTIWNVQIPFNKKVQYAEIPLSSYATSFLNYNAEDIGNLVEEKMKELVTDINMDNK